MGFTDKISGFIDKAKALTRKELEGYKYLLFVLVGADVFGLYWYLGQKKLGTALLMVMLIALGFILFLEGRLPEEPKNAKKHHSNKGHKGGKSKKMDLGKPEEDDSGDFEQDQGFGFQLEGLPDADEYNARLSKAFNVWI